MLLKSVSISLKCIWKLLPLKDDAKADTSLFSISRGRIKGSEPLWYLFSPWPWTWTPTPWCSFTWPNTTCFWFLSLVWSKLTGWRLGGLKRTFEGLPEADDRFSLTGRGLGSLISVPLGQYLNDATPKEEGKRKKKTSWSLIDTKGALTSDTHSFLLS